MLEKLMTDPKVANAELGGGKAAEGFTESYREFVSLPSAKHEYRKLFLSLADQEMLPALFHCTTGKDRTGWAAAALLTLLGVPKDVVIEDYLRSNEYIIPMYRKVIDGAVASGIEEEIRLAILGVKLVLLVPIEAGFRLGMRRHRADPDAKQVVLSDVTLNSMLALLGLMLAFTYSFSMSRADLRKKAFTNEVNAISTAFVKPRLADSGDGGNFS